MGDKLLRSIENGAGNNLPTKARRTSPPGPTKLTLLRQGVVLGGIRRLVLKELRSVFAESSFEFRCATATAIGVGEGELAKWISGATKPSLANVQLIKAWVHRGGFNTPAHVHAATSTNAFNNDIVTLLRAVFRNAPLGALSIAAEEIGITKPSLCDYITGSRRATPETLDQIKNWLSKVDVESYQGLSALEWTVFCGRVSVMNQSEVAQLADKTGISASWLKRLAIQDQESAAPNLPNVRAIKTWLRKGGKPESETNN